MLTHDQAIQAFYDEADELLDILESALLELEKDPHHAEFIAEAFRALHTIKGPASMLGFESIANFTHEIESFFDSIRSGKLLLDAPLLALMLKAKDSLSVLVSQGLHPSQEVEFASQELLFEIKRHINATQSPEQPEDDPVLKVQEDSPVASSTVVPSKKTSDATPTTYLLNFDPCHASLLTGAQPLDLLEELQRLGTLSCAFLHEEVPPLKALHPDTTYGIWKIILNTPTPVEEIEDIFIFVEGEFNIEELDKGALSQDQADKMLDAICKQAQPTEKADIAMPPADDETTAEAEQPSEPVELPPEQKKQEESEEPPATEPEPVPLPKLNLSLDPDPAPPDSAPEPAKEAAPSAPVMHPTSTSIRVDSARLDKLVNMVGEMVIIQSSLSQAASGPLDPAVISRIAEDLERLTDEMRENALGLRMLPIGTIYSNFKRLVHDLSLNLDKEIELVTLGAETELDKTVIDRLKDPLVHILRNCVDHGIEHPQERQDAGKPRTGRISLSSMHSGGDVLITIQDDGHGMDPEKIKEKALQLGLITAERELDPKDVFELIFAPGFSTAQKVSDVSGRGVGMDIVKRSIDDLRGRITIESVLGRGTTMTIRLPLTLAIIDGFNVVVEGESYIVPLANLRGFQERFVRDEIKTIQSIERMGELMPCVSLRRIFEVPGLQPEYERIIICDVEGTLIGLAVDNVIGRQQAVIKSLDSSLRNIKWISGTTVNGDGSISLILDVPQLVRHASRHYN